MQTKLRLGFCPGRKKGDRKMMKIRKAWDLIAIQSHCVVEMLDGTLKMFSRLPARQITEKDLTDYKGHHPEVYAANKAAWETWNIMYRMYGLEKA